LAWKVLLPTDIVGHSKLSVNDQSGAIEELTGIVRLSEQFQKAEAANRILKIPTGDGMALVFYRSPEEPAQCAFEISRALKDNQRLQVRMRAANKVRVIAAGRTTRSRVL